MRKLTDIKLGKSKDLKISVKSKKKMKKLERERHKK